MPKPILQSLILADHVYEDKLTGKRIIAGVFNRIIRGVRVVREIPPPTPAPPYQPPQYQPPQSSQPVQPLPPIQVQPSAPIQPVEPIDVHHGQASVPSHASPASPPAPAGHPQPGFSAPTHPPHEPTPAMPTEASPPMPAGNPGHANAGQPAQPPAPVHAATSVPPVSAPNWPATPATPPSPPSPPPPPQTTQRVLEIPPTGLQSGSPFAYLSLTEVRGVTPLLLQLVNLEDDTQLFRSDLRVECNNPLYTVELTVPLPPITPPQAGIYALELLYNNELLGALRIVVEDAAQS